MSSRAGTILLLLLIPLGCVGAVVSAIGGLYALAAWHAGATLLVAVWAARRILDKESAEPVDANKPMLDRLFGVENVDPIKAAFGQLVVFAALLVVVIDGSGGLLWPVIGLIAFQVVWLVAALVRHRRKDRTKAVKDLTPDNR